jgi:phenol 2-monooxygenase
MSEVAFWNAKPVEEQRKGGRESAIGGIERTSFLPDVTVAARYKHEITIHQGRIERILEENLRLYSERGIERSSRFVDFHIDGKGDPECPVLIEVERDGQDGATQSWALRVKHLVGADGAHSKVRQAMGLKLEGETTDHIWVLAIY